MLGISRTRPFRQFQSATGNATFHINTVVVGLELVARGGQKPADLNINWDAPEHPRHSVDQAKQFVLLAVMVHVVDAIDVLLRDYADLEWLALEESTRDCLRRSVTKPGKGEYSIQERADILLDQLNVDERDARAFLALTVAWRNSLVHDGRTKRTLPKAPEEQLASRAEWFRERYAAIDVAKMLASYRAGRHPTLKEVTTMVAVCQGLARVIDANVIRRVAATADQLCAIVRMELKKSFSSQPARWKNVWGRDTEAQKRTILNYLEERSITQSGGPISATVAPEMILPIAQSVKQELDPNKR